jgi:hypothetical protein
VRQYLTLTLAAGIALSVSAAPHAAEPVSPEARAVAAGAAGPSVTGVLAGAAQARERVPLQHAFTFTRGIYSDFRGGYGGRRGAWSTDFPKADIQFLTVLRRLTILDAYPSENAVALDDPELRRFPFLYMLEVGNMNLTPEQATGLRDYMLAGGFVFIDDFWGTQEWANFEAEMTRVMPEHAIVELPPDHPIFNSLYDINEVLQVPAVGNWRGGRTWERDGYEPKTRAILAADGRLMMFINWNTDIGDAWEWAEQPDYPLKFSTYAYQIGANAVVYALSH